MGKTVKKTKDKTKEYSSCKIIKQFTSRTSRNLNKKHQHFLTFLIFSNKF